MALMPDENARGSVVGLIGHGLAGAYHRGYRYLDALDALYLFVRPGNARPRIMQRPHRTAACSWARTTHRLSLLVRLGALGRARLV
jgi:hypothetical protein